MAQLPPGHVLERVFLSVYSRGSRPTRPLPGSLRRRAVAVVMPTGLHLHPNISVTLMDVKGRRCCFDLLITNEDVLLFIPPVSVNSHS